MRKRVITPEEKIASKLSDVVSDVRLDLDKVGFYLANSFPNLTHRRLEIILESLLQEKERNIERSTRPEYTLFD